MARSLCFGGWQKVRHLHFISFQAMNVCLDVSFHEPCKGKPSKKTTTICNRDRQRGYSFLVQSFLFLQKPWGCQCICLEILLRGLGNTISSFLQPAELSLGDKAPWTLWTNPFLNVFEHLNKFNRSCTS